MSDELLTTTQAAHLAGVGASSVKRWADQNLIRCVKTAGGHRRILRGDLERFLREHGGAPGSGSSEEWADLFLTTGVFEIQGELLRARERLGAWYLVAEEIGGGLTEIGSRWEREDISVLEEHVASERLARAIGRAVESIPSSAAAPRALLATAEGDKHTLGLSLAELCLRECGWSVVWTGRETPSSDIVKAAASGSVEMIALSASIASADPMPLARQAKRVGEACRTAGVELVLGGRGAWPEKPAYGTRVFDLETLHRLAGAALTSRSPRPDSKQ
jgi:excisionase family DNA binding protein